MLNFDISSYSLSQMAAWSYMLTALAFIAAFAIAVYNDFPELVKTHCHPLLMPLSSAPLESLVPPTTTTTLMADTNATEIVTTLFVDSYHTLSEWLPSLSAVVGDQTVARLVFRAIIVWTIIPRLAMAIGYLHLFGVVLKHHPKHDQFKRLPFSGIGISQFLIALIRLFTSVLWILTTSRDNMMVHVVVAALYVGFTLASSISLIITSYFIGATYHEDVDHKRFAKSVTLKSFLTLTQICTVVLMVFFHIKHNHHCQPGAYSRFAVAEWTFAIVTIAIDAQGVTDFKNLSLVFTPNSSIKPSTTAGKAVMTAFE
jgi:hypothetical protein